MKNEEGNELNVMNNITALLSKGKKAEPIMIIGKHMAVLPYLTQPGIPNVVAQPAAKQVKRGRRRHRHRVPDSDDEDPEENQEGNILEDFVRHLPPAAREAADPNPVVARLPRPIRAVRPPPVRHVDVQNVEVELEAMDDTEAFWKIISGLNWHNISDGIINPVTIRNIIAKYSPAHQVIFKECYANLFGILKERLETDGMFTRNGINDDDEKARIVSHVIALGQNQFNTLLDDMEILQFLITSNECQSLHDLLPPTMK